MEFTIYMTANNEFLYVNQMLTGSYLLGVFNYEVEGKKHEQKIFSIVPTQLENLINMAKQVGYIGQEQILEIADHGKVTFTSKKFEIVGETIRATFSFNFE
jgi:hypothetical protein